jgi:hypothetical protein
MKTSWKFWMTLPVAVALLIPGSVASAQDEDNAPVGLVVVNVDLRNARILTNLARDLHVNVSNIPITVQAPINVAAIVCQVNAVILSQAFAAGPSSCYAQQTSTALNRIVQLAIARQ